MSSSSAYLIKGANKARLTPDQKAACSNHVRVITDLYGIMAAALSGLFQLHPKFIGRDTQARPLYLFYIWSGQQGYRRCFFVQEFKLIGIEKIASFLDVQRETRNVSTIVRQSSCKEY